MNKQRALFITLGFILFFALIFGGAYYWYASTQKSVGDVYVPKVNANSNTAADAGTVDAKNTADTNTGGTTAATSTLPTDTEAAAMRLANVFVGRYGTYSNSNNYENITNVLPFMTDSFASTSEAFVQKNKTEKSPTDAFYGITSKVLSVASTQYTEKQAAQIEVSTQRTETKGAEAPRTFTQKALVNVVFVSGTWKIDGLKWE